MLRRSLSLAFLILLFFPLFSGAQQPLDSSPLFSPLVGRKFYEIAYELANREDAAGRQSEQAIIFLTATMNLDSRADYVIPDTIRFASRYSQADYSQLVRQLLAEYVDKSADLEVATGAVRYLLERLNSREQREKLLEELLNTLSGKNAALDSELATLLGLLVAERADLEAAPFYFMQAFNNNNYNKLAFEKLVELAGEQIGPAVGLQHLRLALRENPLNIEAALAFAQYAEKLQLYDVAAEAYKYCVELFRFHYPSRPLPASLYIPWSISNYNTGRNQHICLQIADDLRRSGRFDLLAEAIAGRAAAKIGNKQLSERILKAAEDKALEFAGSGKFIDDELRTGNYEQLAWFYCFARPNATAALDWANKAYSMESNSPTAAAVLAYSLVMNGQTDLAKLLVENYENNQIAELSLARIELAQGREGPGVERLKSAIALDGGSLEAERAKEILTGLGRDYIPPIDPGVTLAVLKNNFGQTIVPVFSPPEQIISVQLNFHGSKFSYGSDFGGAVAIKNNSSEPLVVSDNGLFTGRLRIDADITGDINKKIPNLVSTRIRPALPIEPGLSILVPLQLVTGELKEILFGYPQKSLDIEFTAFIDPVTTDDDETFNRLAGVEPARAVVKRPGTKLASRYLQNRLDSLTKGRQGQRIKTAELFAGLLAEQQRMAGSKPLYKLMYADWMPAMLKSALIHSLADDDWVVRVHTMVAMLSLPLDYELTSAAAENLNNSHWPVRLMAVYLLAKAQDSNFEKVLGWTAEYDSSEFVRDMAVALGANSPQERQLTNQSVLPD